MRVGTTALVVGVLAVSRPAWAETPSDTADLEGLLDTSVVSAPSKSAESDQTAPATSVSITAEDLRRHGIRTLDEAINFLAFGMHTEREFQAAEIGARGVLLTSDFGAHVLLMVDGHVLNEAWGAAAFFDRGTAVPIELIDHIEVVLGPGSVLYGSNAMLGIVHIVTKRAKDFSGAHLVVDSEVPNVLRGAVGYGRAFRLFGSDAEVVFEAEHTEQRGPTFAFGPQDIGPDSVSGVARPFDPSPRDRVHPPGVWGGRGDDAHSSQTPAAYLRLRVGDVEVGARAALFRRTDPTNSGNFDDPDGHEMDRWAHLDVKHGASLSAAVRLSTRVYGDLYDYVQRWPSNGAEDCLAGQDSGCLWVLDGAAQSVGLEPQLTFDWLEDGRVVTLVGIDAKVRHVTSEVNFIDNVTETSPGPVGAYDLSEKAVAAYAQNTAWITQRFALNAGVRLDVDERFGSHASPRAAMSLLPWDGGTWKVVYSEAFRAPSAFEIYYSDPDTQVPGGDGLEPETVRSVEGSIEQRFGTQRVMTGVFHSWWDGLALAEELTPTELQDAIASGALSPNASYAYQVRNVSRVRSFGFSAVYDGSLAAGRLRYGASLTEGFARREDPGLDPELLAVAPRTTANARISYDLGSPLPTLALAGRFTSRRPIETYPDRPAADAFVEALAAVSGPVPGVGGLSYRLTGRWASKDTSAYVVGFGNLSNGRRELAPRQTVVGGVGLQYDFDL